MTFLGKRFDRVTGAGPIKSATEAEKRLKRARLTRHRHKLSTSAYLLCATSVTSDFCHRACLGTRGKVLLCRLKT